MAEDETQRHWFDITSKVETMKRKSRWTSDYILIPKVHVEDGLSKMGEGLSGFFVAQTTGFEDCANSFHCQIWVDIPQSPRITHSVRSVHVAISKVPTGEVVFVNRLSDLRRDCQELAGLSDRSRRRHRGGRRRRW